MSRDKRYQKLLNSPRWAEVKRIVWQRAGGLCERCKRDGFITAGVDCHHIKPVEGAHTVDGPDGMKARAYNPENIELLCVACHIKTHQEMHSHRKDKVAENKARARRRFMESNDPNWTPTSTDGDDGGST
jgi:5-methylcytosine-specific restriction endonuclease McrA